MSTAATRPYRVVDFAEIPGVPCPCGSARRAFADVAEFPATVHVTEISVDVVFIGSCTNGRLSDLQAAAAIVKGRKVASTVHAMVVPGSQLVKLEAEKIGLDRVFTEAGFEWPPGQRFDQEGTNLLPQCKLWSGERGRRRDHTWRLTSPWRR